MNNNLSTELQNLPMAKLKDILKQFDIGYSREDSKKTLIKYIVDRYTDVKRYVSYTYIRQLGSEGKDGRTFLARNDSGEEFAIKIFKNSKSSSGIEREARLQTIAAEHGLSPKVKEYSGTGKYIVMDVLDVNLYDVFCKQKGQLSKAQQKSVIKLFKKLDECGVFHGDPNPLNFMSKNGKWYIIDFGFAKPVKPGEKPNMKYMPLGFKLKLKEVYSQVNLDYIDEILSSS
jgi:serine/threonine protein kinase